MPIGEILEKSFKYPWKNRALWFFGILLAIFSFGTSNSSQYTLDQSQTQKIADYFSGLGSGAIAGFVALGLIALLLWFGLIILGLIITAWSQIAIARGISQLESGKEITRKEIGKTGKRPVWNLIVLDFFIPFGVALGLMLLVLAFVALFYFMPQPAGLWIGVAVGVMATLALIPVLIYWTQVWLLAARFVALEEKKAVESLKEAKKMIKGKFWWTLLLGIVMGMVSGAAGFIGLLPLILLGSITIYLISVDVVVGAVIVGLFTLLYLVFYLLLTGYFVAFTQTGYTIWWLKLKAGQKELPKKAAGKTEKK